MMPPREGPPMECRESRLSRRQFVVGAGGLGLLAGCGRLPWQGPPLRTYRVGLLEYGSAERSAPYWEAFRLNATNPVQQRELLEMEVAAAPLGLELESLEVLEPADIESAGDRAVRNRAEALVVIGGVFTSSHRTAIMDRALRSGLPTI